MSAPSGGETAAFDDQLCLALYRASRAMTATYRPLLVALGLTYPQYLVMVLLWESAPKTVGEIGARLSLDSSTLSPLLKRLDAAGLITRQRNPLDERSVEVSVAPAGELLRRRAAHVPRAICEAVAAEPAEHEQLVGQLRSLASRLESGAGPGLSWEE